MQQNTETGDHTQGGGPLAGIRVLELGSFIAGPFGGQLFGDYGAEVIKVEPPVTGDTMRTWGVSKDGDSLWWPSIARNKKSVTIDLRTDEGRALVRDLASQCDIVLENFRPGRLDDWGLTYDVLSKDNPKLVVVHVSGFGQTGPRSSEAGFGSVGEAMGGVRNTTGSPDRPSSRTGISLGDSLAGVFSVIGGLAALNSAARSGRGQEVDVAIYEAVFALMESTMADFELGSVTRSRTGGVLPGVAPSNSYRTVDGSEILIAANADTVFGRLCKAMGSPDLATDERFSTHQARGARMEEIDQIVEQWTLGKTTEELVAILEEAGVPAGRVYTAPDMLTDAHYEAREMVLRKVSAQGWELPMSGIVPKFSRTPGEVRAVGPELGEHTESVLVGLGVVDEARYAELTRAGIV